MLWFLIILLDNFILMINSNEDQFVLLPKVIGQNDQQGKKLTGQLRILAGHCPLIGRYFASCTKAQCSEKTFASHMRL
jgi:hypothetical protein